MYLDETLKVRVVGQTVLQAIVAFTEVSTVHCVEAKVLHTYMGGIHSKS